MAGAYLVTCWNCLGEFDAGAAVWCSDDPKNPTKLCPFCLRCFCDATSEYKQLFWRGAPATLVDELQTLGRSQDRLGDILIRMKRITTPQLLEALVEQRDTGRKLGEILVAHGFVGRDDVEAALRTQGVTRLNDTRAGDAEGVYWQQSSPDGVLDYLLALGARKRASDVTIEPQAEQVAVRYRIDGFSFRVDPIPKTFEPALERALFAMFGLDAARRKRAQTGRTTCRFGDEDYDLVIQTVPGPLGLTATVKLINRSTFIKDFGTLGLELEDRVRLVEEIRSGLGLVVVSSPAYNGAITTAYSIMSFLAQGQRDVLSIESPVHWQMEGVRQVEAEVGPQRAEDRAGAARDGGGAAGRADGLRRPRPGHGDARHAAGLEPAGRGAGHRHERGARGRGPARAGRLARGPGRLARPRHLAAARPPDLPDLPGAGRGARAADAGGARDRRRRGARPEPSSRARAVRPATRSATAGAGRCSRRCPAAPRCERRSRRVARPRRSSRRRSSPA